MSRPQLYRLESKSGPGNAAKKILAILKMADATVAVLTHYNEEGKMNRYLQVNEITNSIVDRLKVKVKQHRTTQKLMFLSFSTKMTAVEVKVLPGIRKLNNPTLQVREEKYFGKITRSIGWYHVSHLTLSHTAALTRVLE